jgi:glycosyltransferase involved in cell wall biosynthesis
MGPTADIALNAPVGLKAAAKISNQHIQDPIGETPLLRGSVANSFAPNTAHTQHRRLLVTSEEHYSGAISGAVYSSGPATYSFWCRYLEAFDEVVVIARIRSGQDPGDDQQRADGSGVVFHALPDHTGPWQYLRIRRHARAIARASIAECTFYLLRMPGLVSQLVWGEIVRLKKQYAVQVLGDPWEALGPGTWTSLLRPIFRSLATWQLKHICTGAVAVNYVTSETLQQRYPPSKSAYAVGFSDVSLENASVSAETVKRRHQRFQELPWRGSKTRSSIRIGFVGSFAQMYKGPDTLIHAAALCQGHLNFELAMVGAGRCLPEMKALALKLGLADRVEFLGELSSGNSIFDFLDSIDLFLMPSRAEGLPRALVEAMSRGCPCIASEVGGIPELLEPSDLVPPNSPEALAKLILEVAADSNRLLAMSARNLAKAAQFNPQTLKESRRTFLEEVKRRSSL